MKYLLDTNACIGFLRGRPVRLAERIRKVPFADVTLCSVVMAELLVGARKSRDPARETQLVEDFVSYYPILPFDVSAARLYSGIRADLEQRGLPIGANDLLIASIALANDVTLVTHNIQEFLRIKGLLVEDWETP